LTIEHNLGKNQIGTAILAMSEEGLVVTLPNDNQAWVIEPDDLSRVKRRIDVPGVRRVAGGYASKAGVALTMDAGRMSLRTVDLERGQVGPPMTFKSIVSAVALTPNGKHVFLAENGKLLRYRVEGQNFTLDEMSQQIVGFGDITNISPDGQFVCLGGNPAFNLPPGHTARGLYVYPVGNLKTPAITLPIQAGKAVGIDPKSRWILAHDGERPLQLYNMNGVKKSNYEFPGLFGFSVRDFAVSPAGGEALLRANDRIMYFKLKTNEDPIVKVDPKVGPPNSLLANTHKLDGFTAKELALPAVGQTPMIMTEPVWDPQGKWFYGMHLNTIHKVNRAGVSEVSAPLPLACHHLALSSEGLITAPRGLGQIFVLDPKTLEIRAKVNSPVAKWLCASPNSATVLVFDNDISFVDLKTSKSTSAQLVNMPGNLMNARSAALSPDGKILFVQAFDYTTHRLKVEAGKLVHGGSKTSITKGIVRFQISPDSRAVVLTYPALTALNAKKVVVTEVYPVSSFDKFAYTIPGYLKLASFDQDGAMYAVGDKNDLRFYPDPAARPNQFTTLVLQPALARLVLGAPQGGGGLIVASQQTYLLERTGKK
jgi:hypothetical protein